MSDTPAMLHENVPLAPFTTIGIGGNARWFVRVESVDELIAALSWARHSSLPVFILGGGSNLLISDDGFPGLVVQIALAGIVEESEGAAVHVNAAAGESWDGFVAHCTARGLAGVECMSGIPGTVGATPIQNVGAYGQEVSDTIVRVEALDRETLRTRWFTSEECAFRYRDSRFKSEERDRWVVLSVTYRLVPDGRATVRYPELQRHLEEHGVSTSDLEAVRQSVIAIRKRKGMVIDPSDPDTRSDGSFFTNPILDAASMEMFLERARAVVGDDVKIPQFPAGEGFSKLSAAWLIERAGFTKGYGDGPAGLSSKHTLAVINRGNATAADVVRLVDEIVAKVRGTFGVTLVPEPNFIGF